MESFKPWLERLESRIGERTIEETAGEVPAEWYEFDRDSLYRLIEKL